MSQEQSTTTVKMMYSGQLEHITCPLDAKYKDFIEMAFERFAIPDEFKDFIQISNAFNYVFEKDIFEYYTLLFPNPDIIFHIRVDYSALKSRSERSEGRKPFAKLNNKRKSREDEDGYYIAAPVTRQNCFIGFLPGNDTSEPASGTSESGNDNGDQEEPKAKRHKTDSITTKATVVRKTKARRSIRI